MALFKIFKGKDVGQLTDPEDNNYIQPSNDGYAYYDTKTKLFYIDTYYGDNNTTTISREPINAYSAQTDSIGNKITDTYLTKTSGITNIQCNGANLEKTINGATTTVLSVGNGLNLTSSVLTHAAVPSLTASMPVLGYSGSLPYTFIKNITTDEYGHIVDVTTASLTVYSGSVV